VTATGSVSITSKTVSTGIAEATLQLIDISGGGKATVFIAGSVSGPNVTFNNVTFPNYNFMMRISNVRVTATGAAVNTQVFGQIFAAAQGVALIQANAVPVGLVRQGLAPTTISGVANFLVCNGGGTAFTVTAGEAFAGAFKTQNAPTAANQSITLPTYVPAPANIPGGEAGSYIPGGSSVVGTASFGTRIKLVFGGIPANVTLSVPLTVTNIAGGSTTGATIAAVLQGGTETGALSPATSGTLTASGGVATAIYEVTAADLTQIKSIIIAVTASFSSNTVTVPSGPITVVTSYAASPSAPAGALASPIPTIPYFANTGTLLNGATFAACQTVLLYPYVTNLFGFETGLVVANAGLDNLNVGAKNPSYALGQAGACTFNFYGNTGPESATPTAIQPSAANFPSSKASVPTIPVGATHADVLTNVAGGPFQGYAIAVCPFLYAKGFAFIEYGLTTSSGLAEGYVADIINTNRSATYTAGTLAVGNNSPETSGQ
jgi:hypothetical protein